ncbi:hypothetical protein ATJ88_0162 [Isoptericola jiangsuensis]|uniref:SH3 domain-containing protein n=1 Tax=Isoptericola jiangsuensis TaxID=548579 RepID=A0A2A9ETC0_9MICO|nr:hypothetical protein [Isoptericola jiangsuensis]PFG41520.1 hypothetical protein ATJ88_0162 [Isoptericola jiangsuensis]
MNKKLVGGLVGLVLALGAVVVPAGTASAFGSVTCPSGRVVSFTSAKPFSVRVYGPNPGTVYTSFKSGTVYKVITGRQSIAEWHIVSSSATVTPGCTV